MMRELDALLSDMAEEAYKQAGTLDRNNPIAETERILGGILKTVALGAALAALWGRMGEDIEDGTKIAITLRLALDYPEVWNESAKANALSALRGSMTAYEDALRDQTRKAILESIKGAEAGEAVSTIARRIKSMVAGREMYPGVFQEGYKAAKEAGANEEQAIRAGESKARRYRATVIAETETRTYQNVVALEAMQASGTVSKVKVVDGSACGWKKHDDTDKAHNTTRELSEARRYPIVHPNCKRRFFPVED
jgi:hypothetical protein